MAGWKPTPREDTESGWTDMKAARRMTKGHGDGRLEAYPTGGHGERKAPAKKKAAARGKSKSKG